MRLAIAQRNPTVGDLEGNARLVVDAMADATAAGADALLLSELFLSGYPPKDLLWQEGFLESVVTTARQIASQSTDLTLLLGSPWPAIENDPRRDIRNSVLVIRNGRIETRYDKRLLPNYDVFDEQRWFRPGDAPCVIEIAGKRIGVAICEDMWRAEDARCSSRYENEPDPLTELIEAGAECVLVPSASPFGIDKWKRQHDLLLQHASDLRAPFIAVNQLGATDDLIFDGMAAVLAPNGKGAHLVAVGAPFEEDLVVIDPLDATARVPDPLETMPEPEVVFRALRLGLRDYVRKTGHKRLVIGLSGGIDSAVAACLGASAIGAENVLGVGMPSRYSSEGSLTDARELAERLGMPFIVSPIEAMHDAAESTLTPLLGGECARLGLNADSGVAEENVQSRLRAVTIMAFANKTNALALVTGNKSEMATGYATLYGDMSGGLAVLSDLVKRRVYDLARWMNDNPGACGFTKAPIPESSITKPPSAELRPDQTDQDSLPPYDVLDEIVVRYIERRERPSRIVQETGFDEATVKRIVRLIDINEYKRQQAPIGLKITDIAFGSGRRLPIAQRFDSRSV